MEKKNNVDYYKTLSEADRNLAEKNVVWMKKAFKRKENYAALGNMGGKLVFCEGEYPSYLEGFRMIIFKDGKQIAVYNWKTEDGIDDFQGSFQYENRQIWENLLLPYSQRRCTTYHWSYRRY